MSFHVIDVPIIAVCPDDMARNWPPPGVPPETLSPVSVFHQPTHCDRCQVKAWIGPQQLALVRQGAEKVCYLCLAKDRDFQEQAEVPVISLDPDIDDKLRRQF